jgi:hypothetical protein
LEIPNCIKTEILRILILSSPYALAIIITETLKGNLAMANDPASAMITKLSFC